MNRELVWAIDDAALRIRRARLWLGLALSWLAWSAAALALPWLWTAADAQPPPLLLPALGAGALAWAAVWSRICLCSARDPLLVARRIEVLYPSLDAALLAAVEPDPTERGGFLKDALVELVLEHRRTHDWGLVVPPGKLLSLAAFQLVCLGLFLSTMWHTERARQAMSATAAQSPILGDLVVEPGDIELERGSPLIVTARFGAEPPTTVDLIIEDGQSAAARLPMIQGLEDPVFAGRLESVESSLAYHVAFRGRTSPTYHVKTFEFPALVRADAKLDYPDYTELPDKIVEDVRHVTAVEGAQVTLSCLLNKDVATAKLIDQNGKELELRRMAGLQPTYAATITLAESSRYRLRLLDAEGRSEKSSAEIATHVLPNKTPTIKMARPHGDTRVSPIEELTLAAEWSDDFGVLKHGLAYSLAAAEPREIDLSTPTKARKVQARYQLDFEQLHALPDQLVSFFFWAEDYGPDGKVRRTSGDLYFAEVRHFEEIFRQGEQPPGGEQEQRNQNQAPARQAEQLAELQKQIVNGIWTVIRREQGEKPTPAFASDVQTLADSQASALERAEGLAGNLKDAASRANLDEAARSMKGTVTTLTQAKTESESKRMRQALTGAQAAYQALLRLRAREFQIIRGRAQRGQAGGSGGSPSNMRLDQLELSADENRFEQRSSARSTPLAGAGALAESRQIQSRLRELAQRQNDLNQRLREQQSALEAARTPEVRTEIERRLKRLREQEQEILRDADQLRERLEQNPDRERTELARNELEQSREQVRQAAQALERGELPQAVTAGARAGQSLDRLRDQVRRETANQFADEMGAMRQKARQLDQNQRELDRRLEAWDQQPGRALREADDRRQARQGLVEQKKDLEQLVDRMKGAVAEAEESEPLLAESLFDAVKEVEEKKIPEKLENTRQLVDLGIARDAARASREAGAGLTRLREQVERAAERILGDETAALRRARDELDQLADEVDQEIALATGRPPTRPGKANDRENGRESSSQPDGENPNPERRLPGQRAEPSKGEGGQADQAQQKNGQAEGRQGDREGASRQGAQRGDRPGQEQSGRSRSRQAGPEHPVGTGQLDGEPNAQGGQGDRGPRQVDRPGGQAVGDSDQAPGLNRTRDEQQTARSPTRGGLRAGGAGRGGPGAPTGRLDRMLDRLDRAAAAGPIAGAGFRQWSDRLRNVEELLDDPELRTRASQIRDRARGEREEARRHARPPDWTKLQNLVIQPIDELRTRIAQELQNRESQNSLAPVDRDPVPDRFAESVRRYYERLSESQGGSR